ncbi:MAG: SIR2 family protein [Bacteroidetes bacterium]|nr:SIR2 family protein [Bacteroidota bacterium]
MTEISILLGAGFSVNRGYPTAKKLNEKITSLKPEEFCVASEGSLFFKNAGDEDPYKNSGYYIYKFFLTDLINFFSSLKPFNYEEFFDYYYQIHSGEINDDSFNNLCDAFRRKYRVSVDNSNILTQINLIYNQIIAGFLVDNEGVKFYPPVHFGKPIYPGYTGFLNCIETWGSNNIVHIHSLNHDLFLESFNSSDWLNGDLSDGFQEMGSPFFGEDQMNNKIRLRYFSEKYDTRYRLYKLHGSVDQYPFHLNGSIDSYIKTKRGITNTSFSKEIPDGEGKFKYVDDWFNYHSDFLTGVTSKTLRYNQPVYFNKVFNHFQKNLNNSSKLIVIGYGGLDIEINNLIEKHFDSKKPVYIVEPCPHNQTEIFCKRFNAKLIRKTPDNLVLSDFN